MAPTAAPRRTGGGGKREPLAAASPARLHTVPRHAAPLCARRLAARRLDRARLQEGSEKVPRAREPRDGPLCAIEPLAPWRCGSDTSSLSHPFLTSGVCIYICVYSVRAHATRQRVSHSATSRRHLRFSRALFCGRAAAATDGAASAASQAAPLAAPPPIPASAAASAWLTPSGVEAR